MSNLVNLVEPLGSGGRPHRRCRQDGRAQGEVLCAVAVVALLLGLHPPVLEPDLDLALGQAEVGGEDVAPVAANVSGMKPYRNS